MSDSSRPHGLQPTRLLCPWDFPGKSTGVGCHCLLCYLSYLLGIKGIAFLWWNQDRDRMVPKWYPQVWKWVWLYLSLIQRISLSREKGEPSKYLCGLLILEGDVYCHGMRVLTLSPVFLPLSQVYFLFLSRFVFNPAFLCPGTFIYLPSHADLGRSTLN